MEREWKCERSRILRIADHSTASMVMKKTEESVVQCQRLKENLKRRNGRRKAYSARDERKKKENWSVRS